MRLCEWPVPNVCQGVPLQGCAGGWVDQGPRESTGMPAGKAQNHPGSSVRGCLWFPGASPPWIHGGTRHAGISAKEYRTHNTC